MKARERIARWLWNRMAFGFEFDAAKEEILSGYYEDADELLALAQPEPDLLEAAKLALGNIGCHTDRRSDAEVMMALGAAIQKAEEKV